MWDPRVESQLGLDLIKQAWPFALFYIKDLQFAPCTDLDWKLLSDTHWKIADIWCFSAVSLWMDVIVLAWLKIREISTSLDKFKRQRVFVCVCVLVYMGLVSMAVTISSFCLFLMSAFGCAPWSKQMQQIPIQVLIHRFMLKNDKVNS